jgi:hypothetical protein
MDKYFIYFYFFIFIMITCLRDILILNLLKLLIKNRFILSNWKTNGMMLFIIYFIVSQL